MRKICIVVRFQSLHLCKHSTHTNKMKVFFMIPRLLTQSPVIDNGRHAADQLGTGVTHLWVDHALCPLVAAVPLIRLLPDIRGGIPCVEHLHGGVTRHQRDLEKRD